MKLLSALLLLAMVSCAPSASRLNTDGLSSAAVIRNFKPDKGEAAAYPVGQQVSFSYSLERAGFITLVAFDDNGRTYDIERSVAVKAGAQSLPRADDVTGTGGKAAYIVDPPLGPQRVFLIYTDRTAPIGTRISGNFAAADLPKTIKAYISASGSSVYDVSETRFEVVK
jgi:hypothetical protein